MTPQGLFHLSPCESARACVTIVLMVPSFVRMTKHVVLWVELSVNDGQCPEHCPMQHRWLTHLLSQGLHVPQRLTVLLHTAPKRPYHRSINESTKTHLAVAFLSQQFLMTPPWPFHRPACNSQCICVTTNVTATQQPYHQFTTVLVMVANFARSAKYVVLEQKLSVNVGQCL
jgi:hypothetical protein